MSQAISQNRPDLTPQMNVQDFLNFYWLKAELQRFCKQQGLLSHGSKQELTQQIQIFLQTGQKPIKSNVRFRAKPKSHQTKIQKSAIFSLASTAQTGFRFSEEARTFFVSQVGPTFRFSVPLQQFIKNHPGITFTEIITEWKKQKAQKSMNQIAPQFEYNQFTRDFFADPQNRGKTRQDCIDAWKQVRSKRGSHQYERNKIT